MITGIVIGAGSTLALVGLLCFVSFLERLHFRVEAVEVKLDELTEKIGEKKNV